MSTHPAAVGRISGTERILRWGMGEKKFKGEKNRQGD